MVEKSFRSIFISDVHLGTMDCQAELLLAFLSSTSSDYLYLVGDIVDLEKIKRSVHWPRCKNRIANLVMDKAREGTHIVYIPGNHDELIRDFVGTCISGVHIKMEDTHTTAKGESLLILHGDIFDGLVQNSRLLDFVGNGLYDLVMWLSRLFNRTRSRLGFPYWSLSAFIKSRLKEAVRYVQWFEETAARYAAQRGYDGIICGHIHRPNMRKLSGITYLNTGDWVEHCTALVEDADGEFMLIDWPRVYADVTTLPTPASQAA